MPKPAIVLDPGHGGLTSFFYDLDNGVRLSDTWADVQRLDPSDKTYFDPDDHRRWVAGELAVEPRFYFERNGRRITWGDPGDVSPLNPRICEKDLALDVSRSIHRKIGRELRVKATRDRDGFVADESRLAYARRIAEKHDVPSLFVSLHTESSKDPDERGLRLYGSSDASDDLIDCFETELVRHAAAAGSPPLGVVRREPESLAGLPMPSVTVVLGYLSNTGDAQRLLDRVSRQALAHRLARAALHYFAQGLAQDLARDSVQAGSSGSEGGGSGSGSDALRRSTARI